jgi:D-glycero-alpha-D-manno-heptose-7-phosphate kinase
MIIRARAPLRISFAGGGTDVPPFPAEQGGLVLNATINRYAYGTLRPRPDDSIQISSHDYGLSTQFGVHEPLVFDGKLDLAKAAIRRFAGRESRGFDLLLHSNAPPGSGLGSSSAMMVALIGALAEYRNLPVTDYELAELAHSIEREELGIKGGRQDQYAAAFGGFNFIELSEDRVVVNPLRVAPDVMLEQKELAVEMKNALLQRRLRDFGELLHTAWEAKKRLSTRISNDRIEELYEEARRSGAIGGKVTGAGGGGYVLLYCRYDRKHEVAERMIAMDAGVAEFAFEPNGLRTWRVDDD